MTTMCLTPMSIQTIEVTGSEVHVSLDETLGGVCQFITTVPLPEDIGAPPEGYLEMVNGVFEVQTPPALTQHRLILDNQTPFLLTFTELVYPVMPAHAQAPVGTTDDALIYKATEPEHMVLVAPFSNLTLTLIRKSSEEFYWVASGRDNPDLDSPVLTSINWVPTTIALGEPQSQPDYLWEELANRLISFDQPDDGQTPCFSFPTQDLYSRQNDQRNPLPWFHAEFAIYNNLTIPVQLYSYYDEAYQVNQGQTNVNNALLYPGTMVQVICANDRVYLLGRLESVNV